MFEVATLGIGGILGALTKKCPTCPKARELPECMRLCPDVQVPVVIPRLDELIEVMALLNDNIRQLVEAPPITRPPALAKATEMPDIKMLINELKLMNPDLLDEFGIEPVYYATTDTKTVSVANTTILEYEVRTVKANADIFFCTDIVAGGTVADRKTVIVNDNDKVRTVLRHAANTMAGQQLKTPIRVWRPHKIRVVSTVATSGDHDAAFIGFEI